MKNMQVNRRCTHGLLTIIAACGVLFSASAGATGSSADQIVIGADAPPPPPPGSGTGANSNGKEVAGKSSNGKSVGTGGGAGTKSTVAQTGGSNAKSSPSAGTGSGTGGPSAAQQPAPGKYVPPPRRPLNPKLVENIDQIFGETRAANLEKNATRLNLEDGIKDTNGSEPETTQNESDTGKGTAVQNTSSPAQHAGSAANTPTPGKAELPQTPAVDGGTGRGATNAAGPSTVQQPAKPSQEYVVVDATGHLRVLPAAPEQKQASLVVTNALGNTHGILVEEDKLVLSGGKNSTKLQLDDAGATFSEVGTGNAVVVSGVAAGRSAEDAANVGQVQAAVAPLNARLDGMEDQVQRLDNKIKATERKLSAGVAMALALNQPVSFAPQAKSAVTGGVATYNGQSAVGFSYHRLVMNTQTQRTTVSMGVAVSTSGRGSACARVGACFSW